MKNLVLDEKEIVKIICKFMKKKCNGNWDKTKSRVAGLRNHGCDIELVGGKRFSERFYIECKGKSYSKSASSINKEGWLNALGQIITRMNTKRVIHNGKQKGTINRAYKYGLGLYWVGAQVALKRIPKEVAKVLNLFIFSVHENGTVKKFSPKMFGKEYSNVIFYK